jgi:hypothetical protein
MEPSRYAYSHEAMVQGMIDGNGTVHARISCRTCSYDYIWQKETK